MNMSDDVAGATLQVSMKAAEKSIELGSKITEKTLDNIARLLKYLGSLIVKKTDLSDISPGSVSIKKLVQSARKNGDTLSTSENAFNKEDMKIIEKMAKKYGIPIAFTGDKENNYANVRTSDLPVFQRICTDMMKEKLAVKPQTLGNFKVKEWEIPFITSELNNYDLAAQFGTTKNGEHFCLYEKADEKAIMIARNEFVKKCNDLKENMTVTKNEDFYVIKDKRSGKEISFDTVPSREELSEQMQKVFGYDKNKADIACAKFGEENLQGEEKKKFFSQNPQQNFSKIDTNITVQGESIFAKNYTCWRVVPKSDSVPKIVFQDENGRFAVLNPEKQTKKSMRKILKENLNITDKQTLDALVDKAMKVSNYYNEKNLKNLSDVKTFDETDLMLYHYDQLKTSIDDSNNVHTVIPQKVSNFVERQNKDYFTVVSTVEGKENIYTTDGEVECKPISDKQELVLSFSDKQNALNQLTEMYKKQGIPEDIAKQMSKEMFEKAESQSAEKVLNIEEISTETQSGKTKVTVTVTDGNQSKEIDMTDPEKAVAEVAEYFDVSEETARAMVEQAQENIEDIEEETVSESETEEAPSETSETDDFKNDEKTPIPDSTDSKNNAAPPDMPDFSENPAGSVPDTPKTPEVEIPNPNGRGRR